VSGLRVDLTDAHDLKAKAAFLVAQSNKEYEIKSGSQRTLGRSSRCDIVIDHRQVSRCALRIDFDGSSATIANAQSSNRIQVLEPVGEGYKGGGVTLSNSRAKVLLRDGDVLKLAEGLSLRFELRDAPPRAVDAALDDGLLSLGSEDDKKAHPKRRALSNLEPTQLPDSDFDPDAEDERDSRLDALKPIPVEKAKKDLPATPYLSEEDTDPMAAPTKLPQVNGDNDDTVAGANNHDLNSAGVRVGDSLPPKTNLPSASLHTRSAEPSAQLAPTQAESTSRARVATTRRAPSTIAATAGDSQAPPSDSTMRRRATASASNAAVEPSLPDVPAAATSRSARIYARKGAAAVTVLKSTDTDSKRDTVPAQDDAVDANAADTKMPATTDDASASRSRRARAAPKEESAATPVKPPATRKRVRAAADAETPPTQSTSRKRTTASTADKSDSKRSRTADATPARANAPTDAADESDVVDEPSSSDARVSRGKQSADGKAARGKRRSTSDDTTTATTTTKRRRGAIIVDEHATTPSKRSSIATTSKNNSASVQWPLDVVLLTTGVTLSSAQHEFVLARGMKITDVPALGTHVVCGDVVLVSEKLLLAISTAHYVVRIAWIEGARAYVWVCMCCHCVRRHDEERDTAA
jgi:hypothetical protein